MWILSTPVSLCPGLSLWIFLLTPPATSCAASDMVSKIWLAPYWGSDFQPLGQSTVVSGPLFSYFPPVHISRLDTPPWGPWIYFSLKCFVFRYMSVEHQEERLAVSKESNVSDHQSTRPPLNVYNFSFIKWTFASSRKTLFQGTKVILRRQKFKL